jgi:predicted metal-binding protein
MNLPPAILRFPLSSEGTDGRFSAPCKEELKILRVWPMNLLEVYCNQGLELGLTGAKVIDPRSIATAEWVRMKCQYGCPGYGMSLCCPPHTPTPEVTRRVVDSYTKAILLHRRMGQGKKAKDLTQVVIQLERELFLDGYYKAWSMGSGPCRLCRTCNTTGTCQHGHDARPSMEACGIDVFKTARENGFPITVVRTHDEERNFYGVILVE